MPPAPGRRLVRGPIPLTEVVPTERAAASLPVPLTPLVGRTDEVAAVHDLLRRDDVRLVTLIGPGGIGKTRLAIAVATDPPAVFADGVVFVSLATVHDPELILPSLAEALGIRGGGRRSLFDQLVARLAPDDRLVIFDNFEQLVAGATVMTDLLAACPRLKVLVTSRAILHLSGEYALDVPSLALPAPDRAGRHDLAEVEAAPAIHLFVARARAARREFRLSDANAPAASRPKPPTKTERRRKRVCSSGLSRS